MSQSSIPEAFGGKLSTDTNDGVAASVPTHSLLTTAILARYEKMFIRNVRRFDYKTELDKARAYGRREVSVAGASCVQAKDARHRSAWFQLSQPLRLQT